MGENKAKLVSRFGQSLWYDNISRPILRGGVLARMVEEDGIAGVTSNPTIFMKAISEGTHYDGDIGRLAREGKSLEEVVHRLMVGDIREAADILAPVWKRTGGLDGYVSLECDPALAYDARMTVAEARRLFAEVGKPNIMIKVPGTAEGAAAGRELLAAGVNVNFTLLFSPDHYRQVAEAYVEAMEERAGRGEALAGVRSVASFFLSRIDTAVDGKLDELAARADAGERAGILELRGRTAVAVAKVTYRIFLDLFRSPRFEALAGRGANIQRPLWASTGTKDKSYSDVKYVDSLIGPDTVNTLPQATLDAFRDHGRPAETITLDMDGAPAVLDRVEALGISLAEVCAGLQADGVKAFADSFSALKEAVGRKMR